MNAVEIEQAISEPAESLFDATEFPFALLQAFGNKTATIKSDASQITINASRAASL